MAGVVETEHPHIVCDPERCGGSPSIRGTRISVALVATMWKGGDSVEEIVTCYPHLKAAQVYDAISYYLDHQEQLEAQMKSGEIENIAAEMGLVMDSKGFLRRRDVS